MEKSTAQFFAGDEIKSHLFEHNIFKIILFVSIVSSNTSIIWGIEVWVFRGAIEKDKIRSWEQNDHSVKFNLGIRIVKMIPFQSTAMIERENNSCNELDGSLVNYWKISTCIPGTQRICPLQSNRPSLIVSLRPFLSNRPSLIVSLRPFQESK